MIATGPRIARLQTATENRATPNRGKKLGVVIEPLISSGRSPVDKLPCHPREAAISSKIWFCETQSR